MLKINGKYIYDDNKPFFYLGDTAWLLFYNLNEEDAKIYLRNRAELGFNVIQAVLVYSTEGIESGMAHKNVNVNDIKYFEFVKKLVKYGKTLGLYFGLLPSWGSLVKNCSLKEGNAKQYATFLANFYCECDNIIWILGGDVRGDINKNVFNILGTTLKNLNPKTLITFHPFGRTASYLWFNDESWLDFNMFQSGHRRYDQLNLGEWDDKENNEDAFGEDCYKYVIKNKKYKHVKPILDGEPSYEGIVQGLHDLKEPYWEARHVRRYLYWGVLEGACGFVYGNNAIIQFHEDGRSGSYGVRENWKYALSSPGGGEMHYLKDLFLEFDFTKGIARPDLVLNQKQGHHRTSVFASNDYVICYNYKGDLIHLDLTSYVGSFDGYWCNPENNSRSFFGTFTGGKDYKFRPVRKRELSNDWLLILKKTNNK